MQRTQISDGHRLGMKRTQISAEGIDQGCKGHRLVVRTQISGEDTDWGWKRHRLVMDIDQGWQGHRLVMRTQIGAAKDTDQL